jgi:ketosteroid isomerase-like protein
MTEPDNERFRDELGPAVWAALDATNRGDAAAFVIAFTEDATLVDNGRAFSGMDAIARWDAGENTGVQARFAVTSVIRAGRTVTVGVEVSGQGYNGPSTFTFVLDAAGDSITGLVIA